MEGASLGVGRSDIGSISTCPKQIRDELSIGSDFHFDALSRNIWVEGPAFNGDTTSRVGSQAVDYSDWSSWNRATRCWESRHCDTHERGDNEACS